MIIKRLASITIALTLAASLGGCAPANREIQPEESSRPTAPADQYVPEVPDPPQPVPQVTTLAAAVVCTRLVNSYNAYSTVFEDFRFNNGPEDAYRAAVVTFQQEVNTLGSEILQKGIAWDSASIVQSMLFTVSEDAVEIYNAWAAGQFAPGRDINTIVSELEQNYNAVRTSACVTNG